MASKTFKSPSCRRKSVGSPRSPVNECKRVLSRSVDSFSPLCVSPDHAKPKPELLDMIMSSNEETAKIFAKALQAKKDHKKSVTHKAPLFAGTIMARNNVTDYIESKCAKRNMAYMDTSLTIKDSCKQNFSEEESVQDDHLSSSAGTIDSEVLYRMFNASIHSPTPKKSEGSALAKPHSISMPNLFVESSCFLTHMDRSADFTPVPFDGSSDGIVTVSEEEPYNRAMCESNYEK